MAFPRTRPTQTESVRTLAEQLDHERVASAAYGVFRAICSRACPRANPPEEWDRLRIEHQLPWLTLGRKVWLVLEACEGKPMDQAARRVYGLFLHPEHLALALDPGARFDLGHAEPSFAHPAYALLWEAITKFFLILYDCDEAGSAEEAAQFMLDWYTKKAGLQAAR